MAKLQNVTKEENREFSAFRKKIFDDLPLLLQGIIILMSSALYFLVGSFFNFSYVAPSFSISFILSWYSFVSTMYVAFPLSAGSMVMDFSFCSPFKAVLSCLDRFWFGAFADFRTPAMFARSLSFWSLW